MRSTAPLAALVLPAALATACAPDPGAGPPVGSASGSLVPGASATHVLDLDSGMFVLAEVDQINGDATVTLTGPDGETLREVDGLRRGIESISLETEAAGEYVVTVSANEGEAGDYEFHVVRAEPIAADPAERLDQLMSPWDGDDRAGAVAAVIDGGEMALVRTYGMANLSHGVPWRRGTISNIGSVTKQFTAMGLLVLEAQGEVSLDDDIRTHIPELPDFGEPVTPRQLLNHTSGYREIYNLLQIDGTGGEDTFDRERAITVVQRQPELQNRPHTEWNYNNTGFILLSLLAERVTGWSFADHMRESVFEPLRMYDTRMKMAQGELIPGSAQGYSPDVERGGYRTTRDLPASAGAGGVYTTVDDLHRWLGNFRDPVVGGPEAIAAMTTEAVLESGDSTGYGLGLGIDELGGRTLYWHTGGDVSHRAYLGYLPELGSGVILMSNNAGFDLGLGPEIVRLFFADDLEPEEEASASASGAAEGDMSDERKAAIAGDWVLEVQGLSIPMSVTVGDDGEVRLALAGQDPAAARATSDSTLAIAALDAVFTFRADPGGGVDSGVAVQAGTEMTMRRTERTALTAAALQAYAGRYFCEELETFMRIEVEDGGLALHQLGQTPQPLTHVSGDSFSAEPFHLNEIAFERGAGGRVTGFRVSNGRTRGVWFGRWGG